MAIQNNVQAFIDSVFQMAQPAVLVSITNEVKEVASVIFDLSIKVPALESFGGTTYEIYKITPIYTFNPITSVYSGYDLSINDDKQVTMFIKGVKIPNQLLLKSVAANSNKYLVDQVKTKLSSSLFVYLLPPVSQASIFEIFAWVRMVNFDGQYDSDSAKVQSLIPLFISHVNAIRSFESEKDDAVLAEKINEAVSTFTMAVNQKLSEEG
jgi:hypothetical protein